MVKAGEDDGELINSRDRSWPDVLYLAPALYILLNIGYIVLCMKCALVYSSIHCYSLICLFLLNTMRQ